MDDSNDYDKNTRDDNSSPNNVAFSAAHGTNFGCVGLTSYSSEGDLEGNEKSKWDGKGLLQHSLLTTDDVEEITTVYKNGVSEAGILGYELYEKIAMQKPGNGYVRQTEGSEPILTKVENQMTHH